MKKIIIPKNSKMIKELKDEIDGVLLGLKGYSATYETEFELEEIEEIISLLKGKEVFISINKNILNYEIENLYKQLEKLNEMKITGILFYDLAILNRKEKIKHNLWWAQEHFTTNYLTAKYYEEEGVKGAYLSSDITKKDLEEIRKNTKIKLMINAFGYLPIFVSRRNVIENYKKTFQIKNKGKNYYIEKEGKRYPIVERKEGTYVYSAFILNAAEEILSFQDNGFEYIVLNSFQIEEEKFKEIVILFSKITKENKKEIQKKIDEICNSNTDKAFLYRNTIVKVK